MLMDANNAKRLSPVQRVVLPNNSFSANHLRKIENMKILIPLRSYPATVGHRPGDVPLWRDRTVGESKFSCFQSSSNGSPRKNCLAARLVERATTVWHCSHPST